MNEFLVKVVNKVYCKLKVYDVFKCFILPYEIHPEMSHLEIFKASSCFTKVVSYMLLTVAVQFFLDLEHHELFKVLICERVLLYKTCTTDSTLDV